MTGEIPTEIETHVEFDLPATDAKAIAELMKICNLKSHQEVYMNGTALLAWAAREVGAKGRVIAAVDEQAKTYGELRMAALDQARKQGIARVPDPPRDRPEKGSHLALIYSRSDKDLTPGR
jgi:hypothetical protein